MSSNGVDGINPIKAKLVDTQGQTETQRTSASQSNEISELLSSSSANQTTAHTLARGENLNKIAKRYNISLEALLQANPQIQDANLVQVGQKINIPQSTQGTPDATKTQPKTHRVAAGESLSKIAQTYKISVDAILKANPQIKNANKISSGMTINIPNTTSTATPAAQKTGVTTQQNFEDNQSDEIKTIKSEITASEGKKPNAYFAPEGKLTIGIGHQMPDNGKPQFLKDIESEKITPAAKKIKLDEALKTPENAEALRLAIKAELDAAAKNTGIKDVATTVAADRKLTEAQMQLLLNSDVKTAEAAAKSAIGKTSYDQATSGQRQVAVDLQYNTGSIKKKAPNFVKYFKANQMDDAQAELDVFKANGKVQLGLIRRNYKRMLLMNENQTISDAAKEKLLNAYNIDRRNKGLEEVATFEEALPDIQNS